LLHSLSKRSSAAGLRSGFVAGDPKLIGHYSHLRSYGGCQVPLPVQAAPPRCGVTRRMSRENRAKYRRKFDIAEAHWRAATGSTGRRAGSFCGWRSATARQRRCGCGADAGGPGLAGRLYRAGGGRKRNPGEAYIRLAIVHDEATLSAAFERIRRVL
jgi:aspartate/methionine/tyrosine aminotransferase